ncbi:MAG: hypothetical protein IKQ48_03115 [Paludibacteraceae bacterium]|nr:hypothetical protein [Paludibacteraceae bacterium]
MKKSLLFVAAMMAALTMNAQTIAIDGANADWAEVPMLTEPGVSPVVKMIVPQTGLTLPQGTAYCVMVAGEHEQILANYPVIYTDADNNNTTGTAPWFCPAMGYDYEMATWSDGSLSAASQTGNIREMAIMQSAFTTLPFIGSFSAWLTFNWGQLYIPTDPGTQGYKWDESTYHPMYVKPYTFADLNGTHLASATYATHEALAPGDTLDMTNGYANAILMWASWAVELSKPSIYAISANISSTNTASVDLKLVNLATNEIVSAFTSGDLAGGTAVEVGEWDLSNVPAGKYMLKFSNHVEWSAMQLCSITLEASVPSTVNNVKTTTKAQKVIRDGQVYIVRDGKTFNALGTEMK